MRLLLSFAISAALLAVLYAVIDLHALAAAIRGADIPWLAVGLFLIVPITLVTAWRFTLLTMGSRLGLAEATRLVLAASTLNLFLPSKLGDLGKAYVLSSRHGMKGEQALSIVVFEKALDMSSLLLWGMCATVYIGFSRPLVAALSIPVVFLFVLFALMVLPFPAFPALIRLAAVRLPDAAAHKLVAFAQSCGTLAGWFWRRRGRAVGVVAISIALWGVHLFQFWIFTKAVGGAVGVVDTFAFATLSILAGLLPLTLAGIGSRDVAIVFFFAPYLTPGPAAFLGLLATLRYVVPAVAGIPFAGDLAAAATMRRSAARAEEGG